MHPFSFVDMFRRPLCVSKEDVKMFPKQHIIVVHGLEAICKMLALDKINAGGKLPTFGRLAKLHEDLLAWMR